MTASRIHLSLAGLLGAAGVVLWSRAAHGSSSDHLVTAAQMLLLHASAVFGITACRKQGLIASRLASLGVSILILGVVLFSGDLAMRGLIGQRLFAGAAPAGGMMLVAGWIAVAVSALLPNKS